ncbi:hypothetical protein [Halobacillus mangrovi]|uniref:hypothetical protein n=1 Tax=Halobacillus mangrovi TaxID=402384 RepID=UPI003D95ED9F
MNQFSIVQAEENMPYDKCILFQKGRYIAYANKYFYFQNNWDIKVHDWANESTRHYEPIELYTPPKVKMKTKEIKPEEAEEELLFKE